MSPMMGVLMMWASTRTYLPHRVTHAAKNTRLNRVGGRDALVRLVDMVHVASERSASEVLFVLLPPLGPQGVGKHGVSVPEFI